MRTMTSGTLTVQAYDASVWKQERNVLRVVDGNASVCGLFWPTRNPEHLIAEYTLDSNHSVIIDMSDFIRVHDTGTQDVFLRTDGGPDQTVKAEFTVVGLISPGRLLIPTTPYNDSGRFSIVPPSVIYKAPGARLAVEFQGTLAREDMMVAKSATTEGYFITEIGTNHLGDLTVGNFTQLRVYMAGQLVKTLRLQDVPCDVVPACVEWVGVTGARKRAVWMANKNTIEAADQISLLPSVSDFKTLKGRAEGLTLYLDGLTAYDYWYYSDILTSSDVRVLVGDEINASNYAGGILAGGVIDERFRVDVATTRATIPDGNAGEQNKLEITIKWREYYAATL